MGWTLFPFEGVFETADGILNLALYLVDLAVRLQLDVTDRLANHLLDCTRDFLRRSDDPPGIRCLDTRSTIPCDGGSQSALMQIDYV